MQQTVYAATRRLGAKLAAHEPQGVKDGGLARKNAPVERF